MQATPHAIERPRKTVEDYLALPDDVRAELIDGELYVTPAPRTPHQRAVPRVWRALQAYADATGAGEAFVAPYDVHLPNGDIVQPDVAFVKREHADIVRDWIRGVPDLVVEVLSPDRPERDRFVKRAVYERDGVPGDWIVDPEERTVEVLRHDCDRYVPAGWFTGEEAVASPLLEGFSAPLSAVFGGD